ncbi:MAG: hypothetical protein ACI4F7_09885 [Acutalibacteraceae bacterium]
MDDLGAKLAELLNDPESMNRVRQMAENILGESGGGEPPAPDPPTDLSGIGEMLGGGELQSIMSLISKMKSASDDSRVQLISALRPHLSEERKKRADTAIKILKLLDMLPLIKDSGLMNIL